jgi:hypothetical protein
MTKLVERLEFCAWLARQAPELGTGGVADRAAAMYRAARRHQLACEDECNKGESPQTTRRLENVNRFVWKIVQELHGYGFSRTIALASQHDPRGYTLRFTWSEHGRPCEMGIPR